MDLNELNKFNEELDKMLDESEYDKVLVKEAKFLLEDEGWVKLYLEDYDYSIPFQTDKNYENLKGDLENKLCEEIQSGEYFDLDEDEIEGVEISDFVLDKEEGTFKIKIILYDEDEEE